MDNYVLENIQYLLNRNRLSQDDFGGLFEYKKGAFGALIRRRALPPVEVCQQICKYFAISLDDFVNRKLEDLPKSSSGDQEQESNKKYVELLEKSLQDKEEIIAALRERLAGYESGTRKRPA